jgi:hypothetical protein
MAATVRAERTAAALARAAAAAIPARRHIGPATAEYTAGRIAPKEAGRIAEACKDVGGGFRIGPPRSHSRGGTRPARAKGAGQAMPNVDRDAVLEATDLAALAAEVCGEPRGHGRAARWHCPNPAHPDEHPSMGLYLGRRGLWRWKCHACGEGGTAVDLLTTGAGMTVRDALHELARRAGLDPAEPAPAPRRRPPARPAPAPAPAAEADPAVEELVTAAARLLWTPTGSGARRYLHTRGFTDPLLSANRVGFDPGPRHLPRPDGLPRRGPGVVFPAVDPATGRAVHYQLRYLDPRMRRRYDQPVGELAPNPKLAFLTTPAPARPGIAAVCEGFPDALTLAQNGIAAAAVLGTGHAGSGGADALARALVGRHPEAVFAVCFDDDSAAGPGKLPAGQNAAAVLADRLARHGRLVVNLLPPAGVKDVNAWWQHDPAAVAAALARVADAYAGPVPTLGPPAFPAAAVPTPAG